jgi:type I restriction enzyme S subunit
VKVKLSDAFDLQMGKTPTRNDKECWGKGHKWISIGDIGNTGKYISTTKEEITDAGISRSGIKVVPKGTVIMSFKLSIGKTAITAEDMYTNEAIMAFINKGKYEIDTDYLYHMCKGIDWFEGTNKAVLGLTLNKATMSEKEIEIPPLEVQLQVVAVLDKMDELIALRKEQLVKLDQLVKSRFIELFGDPSSNPMGWEDTTVGAECYYIKDGPHKSLPDVGEGNGYPFISVRNIVNGYIDFSTAKYISEQDYHDSIKKCHPQKGDMLYSKGGTTGIAKLIDVDVEFANWVHVAVLKFDNTLNGVFFENMLNSDYCYDQSQRLTKGIANRDLVLSAMAQIKMYKPPIELQERFAAFVEQTDKSKLAIQQSLDKLELLKKSLMQEYFG